MASYQTLGAQDLVPQKASLFKGCWPCRRETGVWNCCGQRYTLRNYWVYNIVASILHLANAVLMIVLFYIPDEDGETQKDVCYQLHMAYGSWQRPNNSSLAPEPDQPFEIVTKYMDTSRLSLHWLIVGFHLLSFFFQIIVIFLDRQSPCRINLCGRISYPYQDLVERSGVNPLRFVEYSISASIMLICIALLTGIYDENTLIAMGTLCASCQLFGLIGELTPNIMVRAFAHFSGWLTLMVAYGIIWVYYGIANYQGSQLDPPRSAPDIVHAVVITLFVLFNFFGVVQLTQFCCKGDNCWYRWIGAEAELSYVMGSLISKTLLGWLIYAQVLVMASPCD